MRFVKFFFVSIILAASFLSCVEGGNSLVGIPANIEKIPGPMSTPVRTALYIDTSRADAIQVIQQVGLYQIPLPQDPTRTVPFFDYIILSGGKMMMGKYSAYLELNEDLRNILNQRRTLLRPLQNMGIKVLFGLQGGGAGVSFGSLRGDYEGFGPLSADDFDTAQDILGNVARISMNRVKNKVTFEQEVFARQIAEARRFFGLDGVEFWDIGGSSPQRNVYPKIGEYFFDGTGTSFVENERDYVFYWIRGGGNFVDLLSYTSEFFGSDTTFMGEADFLQRMITPIFAREVNFGRWFPFEVPRYWFASPMTSLTFLIGSSSEEFGFENSGTMNPVMSFVHPISYSPVIFDFDIITDDSVWQDFSTRISRVEVVPGHFVYNASIFGLIYFQNLGTHNQTQLDRINVIANDLYNQLVIFE